jgi:hypothetical protein
VIGVEGRWGMKWRLRGIDQGRDRMEKRGREIGDGMGGGGTERGEGRRGEWGWRGWRKEGGEGGGGVERVE